MSKPKIRTITIDTLTGIQNEMYMTSVNAPGFDKWKDFGQDIWRLNSELQKLGFETILVLGDPGTGKSTGMRTLPSKTNIWFNADNKNPVWEGGKQEYGKKTNPIAPYHIIPKNYNDILTVLKEGLKQGMFEEERFAILTAHVEEYKQGGEVKYRLKTLGNMATKMQLEGKYETVLYSKAIRDGGETKYVFETQNDGYNTVRSPMGLFEPVIDNDYNFVINKLLNY